MAVGARIDGKWSSRAPELDTSDTGSNSHCTNELDAVQIAARRERRLGPVAER